MFLKLNIYYILNKKEYIFNYTILFPILMSHDYINEYKDIPSTIYIITCKGRIKSDKLYFYGAPGSLFSDSCIIY
jgi:hypothetical protein